MELTTSPYMIPALAFGSVFLLIWSLGQSNQRSERLARQLGRFTANRSVSEAGAASGLFRQRRKLSRFGALDRMLERKGFAAGLDDKLARAALPLRVGEYLLIRWLCALGVAVTAAVFLRSPLMLLPGAVIGYMLPAAYVWHRTRQRMSKLDEQLVDAMMLMAGGGRPGDTI